MKYINQIKIFCLLLCGLLISVTSCEKDEDLTSQTPVISQYSFGISGVNEGSANRSAAANNAKRPKYVILSVADSQGNPLTDTDGNVIYQEHQLDVSRVNGIYTTDPIDLPNGDYQLTAFSVFNSDGEVLYLSPMEGSDMESAVVDALPMNFSNTCQVGDCDHENNTTTVQVVEITDIVTEDACGYHQFNFQIVDIFRYCIKTMCANDDQIIEATVTIRAKKDEDADYTVLLENEPNNSGIISNPVVISDIYDNFIFEATHNGETRTIEHSAEQLAAMDEPFCLEFIDFTCDDDTVVVGDDCDGPFYYDFNELNTTAVQFTLSEAVQLSVGSTLELVYKQTEGTGIELHPNNNFTLDNYFNFFGGIEKGGPNNKLSLESNGTWGDGEFIIGGVGVQVTAMTKTDNPISPTFDYYGWVRLRLEILVGNKVRLSFLKEDGNPINNTLSVIEVTGVNTNDIWVDRVLGHDKELGADGNAKNNIHFREFSIDNSTWDFNQCDTFQFSDQTGGSDIMAIIGDPVVKSEEDLEALRQQNNFNFITDMQKPIIN